jgi:alkanesulfonate monooxygenase SsuD/methylene tetrahydromethanopterin reductase-like flavin-dependent oxidoreductase (luciferase family)
MGVLTALRFNMTNVADPAASHGERYRAALDMAGYADARGVTAVSCEEHHLAATGWLPSPLVMAAALAARTNTARISVNALLITLYDPIRLAEDIAVIDNVADGRFSFVAGMGYRPHEYHAVGRSWEDRAQLMDHCIDTLLKAWGDEPFEYNGRTVDVTPKPQTKPHPFFLIGGMSRPAARRAARFGLPFSPPMAMPEIEAYYTQELVRNNQTGFVYRPENGSATVLLTDDPGAVRAAYGDHMAAEAGEYRSWHRTGVDRPDNRTEVLTPDELLSQTRAGRTEVVMNPLVGGLPLDVGWTSVRLLCDEVLPRLAGCR